MGGPVKIECGPRNKKTPVFVTFDSYEVELRIGDPKLTADKTRLVRLHWEEANQIADALRDAQEAINNRNGESVKVKIECGRYRNKTPVFVQSILGFYVELRIGERKPGQTRFVDLNKDQADQIADALRDAVLKQFDGQRKRRAKIQ